MSATLSLPLDVRLMNLVSQVLLLVLLVMAAGSLASWIGNHPAFAVRGVTVTGDTEHSNAVTLRANITPQLRGTFLSIDLAAVRQVFETMPWVRRAVVQREFPNRLKVTLQEHRAVAFWGSESDSSLVNSHGEVFEANVGEVEQEVLPRLHGPREQSAQVLAVYRALAPLFAELDLTLEELTLTGRGDWQARLDNGGAVALGRGTPDDVTARTHRFLKTLTQVTSRQGRTPAALEVADLRHNEGYALRLRGVSTVEQQAVTRK